MGGWQDVSHVHARVTYVTATARNILPLLQNKRCIIYPFHHAATDEQPMLAEALADALNKVRADFDELEQRLHAIRRTKPRKTRFELDNPDPAVLVTSDLPKVALDLLKGGDAIIWGETYAGIPGTCGQCARQCIVCFSMGAMLPAVTARRKVLQRCAGG